MNVTNARHEIVGKLTLFEILQVKLNYPAGMLKKLGLAFLKHLLRFLQPPFRLVFGIFIELKHHQCREHRFMIVIQILIFAGASKCLKFFHTEVVDIVHILG